MIINRAYKYRIYPNKKQREKIVKQFGACRFVYNYFLRKRIDYYEKTGKKLTYYEISLQLTQLKRDKEYKWLKDVHAQALQQSIRDLDKAYNNFFNNQARFPKFKKKKDKQSFRYPQKFKINEGKIYAPKVGWIKIVLHRPIKGEMKSLTISKSRSGKYFASIQVEEEIDNPIYAGDEIGLDLGLINFIVASTGQKVSNPRHFYNSEKKLERLQRKLSRKKKGSNGYEKLRLKIAKQHEKITNQKKDFLHKLSRQLVDENQVIVVEDLNVKGMMKNSHLSKSIGNAGWSEFVRQLEYKGKWHGCHIEKIDRFFPSSKRCRHCGFINENLKLSDRKWVCPECEAILDRDINAAKNILNWYTVGVTEI